MTPDLIFNSPLLHSQLYYFFVRGLVVMGYVTNSEIMWSFPNHTHTYTRTHRNVLPSSYMSISELIN